MSQINTFFVPVSGGEPFEEELNAFLRGHRVLQIEKAFAGNGWAFCVEWMEGTAAVSSKPPYQKRIDYREVLDEETFVRFAKMRERRKAIAAEDGVPPYMVMTDAQMAEAVKSGEASMEKLKKIPGFGEARLERYGAKLCGHEEGEPKEGRE